MNKINSVVVVLFLILSISIFPQEDTKAFPDGSEWEILTEDMKIGYFLGFNDGLIVGLVNLIEKLKSNEDLLKTMTSLEIINSMHEDFSYPNANYEQVVDGLNQIYKDFSNKHIPIIHLIGLVSKKIKGEISNEDFEKTLQILRQKHTKKK